MFHKTPKFPQLKKSPPKIEMLRQKRESISKMLRGALAAEKEVTGINALLRKLDAEIEAEVAKTKKPAA